MVMNVANDVGNLSKFPKTEEKLYHCNGLQRGFNLIGDSRVTRWLSHAA